MMMYAGKEYWFGTRESAWHCRGSQFVGLIRLPIRGRDDRTTGLCSGEIRGKKLEYFFVGKLGLVGKEQVTGVFEQDELCARNSA
jgi:hypothetical protein